MPSGTRCVVRAPRPRGPQNTQPAACSPQPTACSPPRPRPADDSPPVGAWVWIDDHGNVPTATTPPEASHAPVEVAKPPPPPDFNQWRTLRAGAAPPAEVDSLLGGFQRHLEGTLNLVRGTANGYVATLRSLLTADGLRGFGLQGPRRLDAKLTADIRKSDGLQSGMPPETWRRRRGKHAAGLGRALEYVKHLGASAAPGELDSLLAEEAALLASLGSSKKKDGRGRPAGPAARDKCGYGFPGCGFTHGRGRIPEDDPRFARSGNVGDDGGRPHSAACRAATAETNKKSAKARLSVKARPKTTPGPPAAAPGGPEWFKEALKTSKASRGRKQATKASKARKSSPASSPGLRLRPPNALSVARAMTRHRPKWEWKADDGAVRQLAQCCSGGGRGRGGGGDDGGGDDDCSSRPRRP